MFNVWMSDALKERAKSVLHAQSPHVKDIKSCNEALHTKYCVGSRNFQMVSDLRKFKHVRKTSLNAQFKIHEGFFEQINQEA